MPGTRLFLLLLQIVQNDLCLQGKQVGSLMALTCLRWLQTTKNPHHL